jgi:hypothetical protein
MNYLYLAALTMQHKQNKECEQVVVPKPNLIEVTKNQHKYYNYSRLNNFNKFPTQAITRQNFNRTSKKSTY